MAEAAKDVIDGTPKALAGVLAGSLMVMVKAAKQCDDGADCEDYLGWALACAVIGVVVSIVAIILLKCVADFKKSIGWLIIVLFLGALWIAGVATMTFKKPYKNTADNGYFGAWIATLSTMTLLSESFQSVCEDCKKKLNIGEAWNWWFILLTASAVGLAQSAIDCDEAADCKDELAWAVAVTAISVTVCIVMLVLACVMETGAELWKWISLFLVVLWLPGTGVSTYKNGPYLSLGNGYFAVWIALIASFRLFGLLFFTGSTGAVEDTVKEAEDFARKEGNAHISGLLVFSLAVLIAAAIHCDETDKCENYEGWAVACSVISFVICLFLLIAIALDFLGESLKLVKIICAVLLLCFWFAGTYTMTFKRPFAKVADNGYFGAWISLIIAWWFATSTVPGLKEAADKLTQYGGWAYQVMAIGSLILGVQAAHDCHDYDCGEKNYGWAVSCGWISFVLVLVVMVLIACDCYSRIVQIIFAIFFAGWWTLGASILTYERPYLTFGNAYFGIWIATVCSYLILVQVLLFGSDGTTVPEVTANEPSADAPADAEDKAEEP